MVGLDKVRFEARFQSLLKDRAWLYNWRLKMIVVADIITPDGSEDDFIALAGLDRQQLVSQFGEMRRKHDLKASKYTKFVLVYSKLT